jgi:hypothetical protein
MIRARFYTDLDDFRPVEWPIKHPYWSTGYNSTNSIVVAYADDLAEVLRLWPDAEDIGVEEVTEYVFNSRFPKPEWLSQPSEAK